MRPLVLMAMLALMLERPVPMALDEPLVGPLAKAIEVVPIPGQVPLRTRESDVCVPVVGVLVDPIDVARTRGVPKLIVHGLACLPFDLAIGQAGVLVGVIRNREHDRARKAALLGPVDEPIDLPAGQRAAGFVAEISVVPAFDIADEIACPLAPIVRPDDHAGFSPSFVRH
jgi:hypothetical protein